MTNIAAADCWNCPKCNRPSLPCDGVNGRPGKPIAESGNHRYYCAACQEPFEAVQAPEKPAGDPVRKKNIDETEAFINHKG